MPLVSVVGENVHDNRGQHVGWRNEALRFSHVEPHAHVQNDWKEIRDRISTCGGQAKERGKAPDLEIQSMLEVLLDLESVACQ